MPGVRRGRVCLEGTRPLAACIITRFLFYASKNKQILEVNHRVQRKSVLQPAIWASCSYSTSPQVISTSLKTLFD